MAFNCQEIKGLLTYLNTQVTFKAYLYNNTVYCV